jgi:hypothetical protein
LWGSEDLGYDLKFELGYKDKTRWRASGDRSRAFYMVAEREVAESLPVVSYTDGQGAVHSFENCYRVDVDLHYDPILDHK